jgi:CheY-like chemotaxis protein
MLSRRLESNFTQSNQDSQTHRQSIEWHEICQVEHAMKVTHPQEETRILIVEDEMLVIWSLSETLKRAGFNVVAVQTGEQAIEKLKGERIDLLITDMNLPQMTGIEVAAVAKRLRTPIPVIMITAAELPPVDVTSASRCVDHIVEKPFDLREIASLVEQCVSHAHEA